MDNEFGEIESKLSKKYGDIENISWLNQDGGLVTFEIKNGDETGLYSTRDKQVLFEPGWNEFTDHQDLLLYSVVNKNKFVNYFDYSGEAILDDPSIGKITQRFKNNVFLVETSPFSIESPPWSGSKNEILLFASKAKNKIVKTRVKNVEPIQSGRHLKIQLENGDEGFFDTTTYKWTVNP